MEHVRRRAVAVEGLADAAEHIAAVPGLDRAVEREHAVVAVDVLGGRAALRALQHLAQWCGKILREAGGRVARRLRHQRPVAGVGVRGAALCREPVERVVDIRCRAVVGEVARGVIGPADDLIGRVVRVAVGHTAVDADLSAVADQIVGIAVRRAGLLRRPDEAVETIVAVGDRAGLLHQHRCVGRAAPSVRMGRQALALARAGLGREAEGAGCWVQADGPREHPQMMPPVQGVAVGRGVLVAPGVLVAGGILNCTSQPHQQQSRSTESGGMGHQQWTHPYFVVTLLSPSLLISLYG